MSALKVTKGKPFSAGVVFINGKYIEPPYVVERYGNVLRINKLQITNPVVDWSEFLKTQDGAVVTRTEIAAEPEAPSAEPVQAIPVSESSTSSDALDDLFDDVPVDSSPAASAPAPAPAPVRKPAAPRVRTSVKLEGDFAMNDKCRAHVRKINAMRTEIDATLRRGGFFCFGSTYSRVSGDAETANRILGELPAIMKSNSGYAGFAAAVRKAGFVYFSPSLVRELFANRIDYPVIQRRWKKIQEDRDFNAMLRKAGVSPM